MSSALVVDDLLNSVRNVYLRIEPKSSYAEQIFARWKKYDDGWDKITRLQDMRPKAEAFFDDEDVLSDVEQLLKALGETQATLLTLQGHEPDTTYGMDQETIEFYRDLRSLVRKKDGDKIDVLQRKAMDSLKRKLYPVMRLEKG
ncbi:MAG: hypothetical protein BM562_11410 [Alphaproteobacteria bacterium MedPE-SWcel]|nr:MAG: hypothetical protein BM562_11410 [Alphaproteobacteria bacterium MedPE-SWcel]